MAMRIYMDLIVTLNLTRTTSEYVLLSTYYGFKQNVTKGRSKDTSNLQMISVLLLIRLVMQMTLRFPLSPVLVLQHTPSHLC
jgi:hypothetical protein